MLPEAGPDFRALFESAPGLYVVMTPSFEIVAASDAYLAATQAARDDIVGRHFFEVFADTADDRGTSGARRLMASLQRVLSERRPDVMPVEKLDVRSPSSRGGAQERAWSRVNSPVLDAGGEVRYITHRIEDVTESIKLKEDFLAMLGHELRNPLAAIASATEILKRIGDTSGTAGQSRAVIERQVRHLKRLLDDLLDAARVQGGKVTLERRSVDLVDAVHQALSTLRGTGILAAQHSVDVDAEPVGVNVDPVRLEQVLLSLLTNAVKFTPMGRAIRVRVRAEGETAVLVVEDEGIGMSEEILPRIFDLFFQGERTAARTEGGLGIGLTLVKTLTELHGGSVEATSAGRGLGSTFVVRLPRAGIPSAASRRTSRAASARRRVLLVEDNDDARDMLKTWLTLEGHEVLEATNGADGVRILVGERPDVAFIDIGLPEMDGYEVARTARRQAEQTLLVALTGYGQAEDRQRCFDAGFDDFVLKPVDPARLSQILAERTAALRW